MKAAYFISDAHLGSDIPGCGDREEVLLSFLREIAPRAEYLFIVGDLFDFWIEYRRAIRPDYFRILAELHRLSRSGTKIHYCMGNHDFAIGHFIEDTIGITIYPDGFQGELQGKRLYVTHGDELRCSDRSNLFLRRLLRNPVLQFCYKVLHPNIGVPLGELFSRLSRKHLQIHASEEILEEYRRAAGRLLDTGYDIFIAGHTHLPELRYLVNGIYCNTGNWISRYSFAMLEDGEIGLWRYLPGQPPERIVS